MSIAATLGIVSSVSHLSVNLPLGVFVSAQLSPKSPRKVAVTLFPDEKACTFDRRDLTAGQLKELILDTRAGAKKALPWLRLAVFGNVRTKDNCLRHTENLVEIHGTEIDYDFEQHTFEQACKSLKRAGLNAIVYTSPSNKGEKHRWRVLLPFATPVPCNAEVLAERKAERVAYTQHVEHVLGHYCGDESNVLAQGWYFGAAEAENTELKCEVILGGTFIDQVEELLQYAGGERPRAERSGGALYSPEQALDNIREGHDIHYSLVSLTAHWARLGVPAEAIYERVRDQLYPEIEATRGADLIARLERGELTRMVEGAADRYDGDFAPVEEVHEAPEPVNTFWNADAYQEKPLPRWLIPDMLQRGTLAFIYGEPGCGKSALAMSLAMGFAGGADEVLGPLPVWERGAALYFAMEGSVRLRTQPFYQAGLVRSPHIRFEDTITLAVETHEGFAYLRARLRQAKKIDPSLALCIIDTLARATPGVDENTADLGAIAVKLDHLAKEFDVCMLVIHHSGKDASRGMRGHSSVKGAVNTEIEVQRDDAGRRFRVTKQREGEDGQCYGFHLDVVGLGHYPGHPERPVTGIIARVEGEPGRRPERRREPASKVQKVVWRRLVALAPNGERVPTEVLIQDAIGQFPKPEAGKDDRRRDTVRRALVSLRDGFVKFEEVDGEQQVYLV